MKKDNIVNKEKVMIICFILPIVIFSGSMILLSIYNNQIDYEFNQIKVSANYNNYKITLGNPYNWINASSGKRLSIEDNDYVSTTLPFNFTFYNEVFTETYITTEGYLTFSFKSVQETGTIPSNHPHRQKIIAPYWTNLDGTYGNLYIENFTSYWVVAWVNFNHDNGSFAGSFEAVLYNNGDIVFNYDKLENISTYACGLNYGDNYNYTSYNELTSGINDFSIKFSITSSNGGTGVADGNLINIIIAVVVTLSIVSIASGITLYYYKKNPEQFRAKLSRGKAKVKEGTSRLREKVKSGLAKSKEKVSKNKKRIKKKTPKND
ncbi:MAG: hypothetical protein ACFFEO_03990 [Candidatus Thorarchaeota archaeon]